jgi:hypothetical protein
MLLLLLLLAPHNIHLTTCTSRPNSEHLNLRPTVRHRTARQPAQSPTRGRTPISNKTDTINKGACQTTNKYEHCQTTNKYDYSITGSLL